MVDLVELIYYSKKWYSLYPGVVAPVSATFLRPHYAELRQRRGAARAALDAAVGLGFLAWLPWRTRAVARKFGFDRDWRRRTLRIARQRFADPNDIALFRIEYAAALDGYIRRFEDAALNKRINPLGWTRDCALADKVRFYARCAAAGLPHPQVAAVVAGGTVERVEATGAAPLLVKPARGEGGRGVAILDPRRSPADADFADRLRAEFAKRPGVWIVQRRIAVHPALADLALNALPTVRLTTILDEHGSPEAVSAVLRMASNPAAAVDNMKAGGILAPVDLATGRLGLGCKGYGGGDYTAHPVTGAAIPGRTLPDWDAAIALVQHAHRTAFADYALIGWDVALSPDGPLLIEGNAKPGVLMPQRSARLGLGSTRYGVLLAHRLAVAAAQTS